MFYFKPRAHKYINLCIANETIFLCEKYPPVLSFFLLAFQERAKKNSFTFCSERRFQLHSRPLKKERLKPFCVSMHNRIIWKNLHTLRHECWIVLWHGALELRRLPAAPTFEVCSKLTWINGFASLPLRFLSRNFACKPSNRAPNSGDWKADLLCAFLRSRTICIHTKMIEIFMPFNAISLYVCYATNSILFDLYLSIRSEIYWNSLFRFTSFNLILILSHSGGTNGRRQQTSLRRRQHSGNTENTRRINAMDLDIFFGFTIKSFSVWPTNAVSFSVWLGCDMLCYTRRMDSRKRLHCGWRNTTYAVDVWFCMYSECVHISICGYDITCVNYYMKFPWFIHRRTKAYKHFASLFVSRKICRRQNLTFRTKSQ